MGRVENRLPRVLRKGMVMAQTSDKYQYQDRAPFLFCSMAFFSFFLCFCLSKKHCLIENVLEVCEQQGEQMPLGPPLVFINECTTRGCWVLVQLVSLEALESQCKSVSGPPPPPHHMPFLILMSSQVVDGLIPMCPIQLCPQHQVSSLVSSITTHVVSRAVEVPVKLQSTPNHIKPSRHKQKSLPHPDEYICSHSCHCFHSQHQSGTVNNNIVESQPIPKWTKNVLRVFVPARCRLSLNELRFQIQIRINNGVGETKMSAKWLMRHKHGHFCVMCWTHFGLQLDIEVDQIMHGTMCCITWGGLRPNEQHLMGGCNMSVFGVSCQNRSRGPGKIVHQELLRCGRCKVDLLISFTSMYPYRHHYRRLQNRWHKNEVPPSLLHHALGPQGWRDEASEMESNFLDQILDIFCQCFCLVFSWRLISSQQLEPVPQTMMSMPSQPWDNISSTIE